MPHMADDYTRTIADLQADLLVEVETVEAATVSLWNVFRLIPLLETQCGELIQYQPEKDNVDAAC